MTRLPLLYLSHFVDLPGYHRLSLQFVGGFRLCLHVVRMNEGAGPDRADMNTRSNWSVRICRVEFAAMECGAAKPADCQRRLV